MFYNDSIFLKMKVAFVTPMFPSPDFGGGQHTLSTIKRLQNQGHSIFIFTCTNEPVKKKHLLFLEKEKIKIGKVVYNSNIAPNINKSHKFLLFLNTFFSSMPFNSCKFYSKEIEETLKEFTDKKKVDILWIDHIHLAFYISSFTNFPSVLQSHGLYSLLFKGMFLKDSSIQKKIFGLFEYVKYYFFEKRYLPRFSKIFAISENDKLDIENLTGRKDIDIIFPYVKIQKHRSKMKQSNNILLFVGYIGWYPNRDGILWFLEKVYPLIQKKIKDIQLWIVGKLPDNFNSPIYNGVKFLGYQINIDQYFDKAQVFIVPIRYGNGIRLKILNAMSYGISIVSTPIGAEGLKIKDKRELLLAETEEEFVRKIIILLESKNLQEKLIHNSFRYLLQLNIQHKKLIKL